MLVCALTVVFLISLSSTGMFQTALLPQPAVAAVEIQHTLCPSNYTYLEKVGKCFRFHADINATWSQAQDHCETEGATLVIIKDEADSNGVKKLLEILQLETTFTSFWLGLRNVYMGARTEFRWIDDRSHLTYDLWGENEPAAYETNPFWRLCVEQRYNLNTSSYFWKDRFCTDTIPYICEMPNKVFSACSLFSYSNTERKKCVGVSRSLGWRLAWDQSKKFCSVLNYDMIVIKDSSYESFVRGLLITENLYWIGLRNTPAGKFQWDDGGFLDYSNWGEDQPDYESRDADSPDICVVMTRNRKWLDMKCGSRNYFLCDQDFAEPMMCNGGAGWVLNVTTRKCYKVGDDDKTFGESRAECQEDGGDLVSISDSGNKDFIIELINQVQDSSETVRYWVGLLPSTDDRCPVYQWLDGACFEDPNRLNHTASDAEDCTTVHYDDGLMALVYTEEVCDGGLGRYRPICQRHAVMGYRTVECPMGYVSFVSSNEGRVICTMEKTIPQTWEASRNDCSRTGGKLFIADEQQDEFEALVNGPNAKIQSTFLWSKDCDVYSVGKKSYDGRSCGEQYPYVCQHPGNIRSSGINVRNLTHLIYENVLVLSGDGANETDILVFDVCMASNLTHLRDLYGWTNSSSLVKAVIDETDFSRYIRNDSITCLVDGTDHCCDVADFKPKESQVEVSFTIDKIYCLCRGGGLTVETPEIATTGTEMSPEVVSLLKNLTTPKNGSEPPNNLCPCRCDSMNIDFNPSPNVLSGMISKIQKELIVDADQLSSKRNKKISAEDTRTGSQTIGYVGIVLFLVPPCLLIVLDMTSLFKTKTQK